MTETSGEYIDRLHQECAEAVADIRRVVAAARARVEQWEPRPMPEA
jgi:hypothetical protein